MGESIALRPFCGSEESRPYLHQPFTMGEHTFATNGHILVRTAARADIPAVSADFPITAEKLNRVWAGHDGDVFHAIAPVSLPERLSDEHCMFCDGRGTAHECPTCKCECGACSGTGRGDADANQYAQIGVAFFQRRYLRLLLTLPDLRIAKPSSPEASLAFQFDGGEGRLMPVHGKYSDALQVGLVTP